MVREYDPKFSMEPPANYDPENPYADRVAFLEMKYYLVRRKFIDIEKTKIIREKMRECYMREGVNHFQNCKEIMELYWKMSRNATMGVGHAGPFDEQKLYRGKFAFE